MRCDVGDDKLAQYGSDSAFAQLVRTPRRMFLEPQDSVSIDAFLQQLQREQSAPQLTDYDDENKSSDSQSSDTDDAEEDCLATPQGQHTIDRQVYDAIAQDVQVATFIDAHHSKICRDSESVQGSSPHTHNQRIASTWAQKTAQGWTAPEGSAVQMPRRWRESEPNPTHQSVRIPRASPEFDNRMLSVPGAGPEYQRPASVPIVRTSVPIVRTSVPTPRPLHAVGDAANGEVVVCTGISRKLLPCGAPSRNFVDSVDPSQPEPLHDCSVVEDTIEDDREILSCQNAMHRRLVYEYRIGRNHLYSVEKDQFPPPPLGDTGTGITVSEPYSRHQFSRAPLMFQSQFESGNLMRAVQVDDASYELWIQPDVNTRGNTQWYYFSIKGMQPAVEYVFRIVNFSKSSSLYNQGMRPLAFSMNRNRRDGTTWYRAGDRVCYYGNGFPRPSRRGHKQKHHYTLRFSMCFDEECDGDTVYLAYCCPYTFTELQSYLCKLRQDPIKALTFKSKLLCKTLAGNECTCLSVTNRTNNPADLETRRVVVISARVHPGETCSSFMMEGVISFLTSDCSEAHWLRDNFIFKLIPMLNPDGVVNGNYRTSLSGDDLNRRWLHPKSTLQPEVWHLKELIGSCCQKQGVEMFVDLHGHSKRKNCFMYGCSMPSTSSSPRVECIFPFLMSQVCENFSFNSCSFKVAKSKRSTGRVVSGSQLHITKSYTMETSFLCSEGSNVHYTPKDFKQMGESLCHALYTYATIHRPNCDHLMKIGRNPNQSAYHCATRMSGTHGDTCSQMLDQIQTLTDQTVDVESAGSCSSPSADECSEPEFDVLFKRKKEKKKRVKKSGNRAVSSRIELWTHLRHDEKEQLAGSKAAAMSTRPQTPAKRAPLSRGKIDGFELKGLSSVNRFKHTVMKARGNPISSFTSLVPFGSVESNSSGWVNPQLKRLWTKSSDALNTTQVESPSSTDIHDSALIASPSSKQTAKPTPQRQRQRNQLLEVVGNRNVRQSKLKKYFGNSYLQR